MAQGTIYNEAVGPLHSLRQTLLLLLLLPRLNLNYLSFQVTTLGRNLDFIMEDSISGF